MSLILEALKKSEAERRLGQAPELLTPQALPVAVSPHAWLPGFLLGLVVAVLALGGLGWWLAGPIISGTDATVPATAPVAVPVPEATIDVPVAAVPASVHPAPMAPPVRSRIPSPRDEAQVIARMPLPDDPDFNGSERESVAFPAASVPLATEATTARAITPAAPASPPSLPSVPLPGGGEPAIGSAPAPALAALAPVQTLATLPAPQRDGLPPLRLSMHVFDPEPQARFVLIDGHRRRQGETIADGLVLEEIRPDGVVLVRAGTRFLVPRP